MLVVYRTNEGHEGEIVSIDRDTPATAFQTYLDANPETAADIAVLDIAEGDIAADDLAALVAQAGGYGEQRFYVGPDPTDGTMSLLGET